MHALFEHGEGPGRLDRIQICRKARIDMIEMNCLLRITRNAMRRYCFIYEDDYLLIVSNRVESSVMRIMFLTE